MTVRTKRKVIATRRDGQIERLSGFYGRSGDSSVPSGGNTIVDLSDYYTKTETDTEIGAAISNLIDGAPDLLNTLNELSAAINDDQNFYTKVGILAENETVTGVWEFTNTKMSALSDVSYGGQSTDDVLSWNGSTWAGASDYTRSIRNETITGGWTFNEEITMAAGDYKGLRFWNSDSHKLYMSSYGHAEAGRLDASSDYNIYLKTGGGTNRGFVFKNGTTPVAQIDGSGNLFLTGQQYIDGSLSDRAGFTSGFAGSGWKLNTSDNSLTVDNLTVRKGMKVYELEIEKIRSGNGNYMFSDGVKTQRVSEDSANYYIWLDENNAPNMIPFLVNDLTRSQNFTDGRSFEGRISYVDQTRSVFGISKTGFVGDMPIANDDIIRDGNVTNTSRQGMVYITSNDDGAPYIDVINGKNAIGQNYTTKVRLGKLDGITDVNAGLSGSQTNYYGLYSDNVHLKGHIFATSGNIGGWASDGGKLSSSNLEFDSTGFIRQTANKWRFNNDGSFILGNGNITGDSTGNITMSGNTSISFGTNTNNLIDWRDEWTIGTGSTANYLVNGADSENSRELISTPFGTDGIGWVCKAIPNNGADGGWDTSLINIDDNYGYRYSVWVRKSVNLSDGRTYHGCQGVCNLGSSTVNTNPYFWDGNLPSTDWYLMVGIIHPKSYTGTYSGVSGVYDQNGKKVLNGADYKWFDSVAYFRSYLYYTELSGTEQQFFNPMVHQLDGSEPSLNELVKNQITGTYLDSNGVYTGTLTAGQCNVLGLTATTGTVGGFNITSNKLYSDIGSYGSIEMYSTSTLKHFQVKTDNTNYVRMWSSASDYGIKGITGNQTVFQLGSTNKIGGINFDQSYMWTGTKKTSDGYSVNGITWYNSGSFRTPTLWLNASGGMGIRTNNGAGKRIDMSSSTNSLRLYNDNNNTSVRIDESGSAGILQTYAYSGNSLLAQSYLNGSGVFTFSGDSVDQVSMSITNGTTYIRATSLPTSSYGLSSGQFYRSGSYVMVVP